MIKTFFSAIIVFFLVVIHLQSQNAMVDSLNQILDQASVEKKATIYNQLARLNYFEDPQKTIDFGNQALTIAEEFDNKEEQYFALLHIGVGFSILGENQKPLEYHLLALAIAEELGDEKKLANVYNELGIDYKYIGDFEKAIAYFLKSLSAKEALDQKNSSTKNKKSIANAMNNIGIVYDDMGNFDKALEYYHMALEIRQKIDDQKGMASVFHNIGVVYEEKGEFQKSLEYYLKSLAIKEEVGSKRSIARTIGNIGIIYLDLGDYTKALEYHKEALKTYREFDDQRAESNLLNSIADIYLEMKEPTKAYPYIVEAIEIAKEIGSNRNLIDSYKFLASYYFLSGNYKKAYSAQKQLITLKDSLFNSEMTESIAEMQTKYETEKKEQEIQLLTKDNEIQELKIKKQSTQLYFLISFAILIILVGYLVFNRYKLKQKQYQSNLEKKNLETEQRMLRSQMNPHFIFNSMNSIQSYISGNDNFTAMTYLSKFAQLMRGILENSRKKMISLEEEINTLNLYVELERLRFNNKFDFKLEVDSKLFPETTYIPPMLVQPFAENAIKHGLKNLNGNGLLKVGFEKKGNMIECTVEDNGIGREKSKLMNKSKNNDHQSLGMQVTQERIVAFKKDMDVNSNLVISDLKDKNGIASGTLVKVLFPFEEE